MLRMLEIELQAVVLLIWWLTSGVDCPGVQCLARRQGAIPHSFLGSVKEAEHEMEVRGQINVMDK